MGGNVSGGNLVHREALVARNLQKLYPLGLYAAVFANSDWKSALRIVLEHLDVNGAGRPSVQEKNAARVILYGHSWGASETVTLARRLEQLGIPVLLTIQIDSVEKLNENDGSIPPNVREAVNFYETEGTSHGRNSITAMDPSQTTIVGNYQMSYREHPVSWRRVPVVRADVHEAAHRDRERSRGMGQDCGADPQADALTRADSYLDRLRVISPPGKSPWSDLEVSLISSPAALTVPSWLMVMPLKATVKEILSPSILPLPMAMASP